jgi:FKBP-type peptidyl-prolyl cis-trans isomerase
MRGPWTLAFVAAIASCGGSDEPETVRETSAEVVLPGPSEDAESAGDLVEGEVGLRELKDGLVVETTVGGRGRAAQNGDTLRVHYEGRVAESGAVFASTRTMGIPYAFVLGRKQVIPGWELALRGARPGSEHKLAVPASLAYASQGFGAVPPDAALNFDIRIVAVEAR